jgi:hypothetical protein
MFPFFPLSPQFDPQDGAAWQSLAREIESYILQLWDLDEAPQGTVALMREFFWMAFIASFPSFPFGEWPCWDARISMEGTFVSYWIDDSNLDELQRNDVTTRQFIWDELSDAVTVFLSLPITSEILP